MAIGTAMRDQREHNGEDIFHVVSAIPDKAAVNQFLVELASIQRRLKPL